MFCEKCGAKLPDGAAFCINCGTPVQNDGGTAQVAAQPLPNQNTYTVPSYPNQDAPAAQPYPNQNTYAAPPYPDQNAYAAPPFPNQNLYPEEPPIKTKFNWVPITLAMVSLMLWGALGGDSDLDEVNVFDWICAGLSSISFFTAFYLIPQRRRVLRTVAIIVTGFMAFITVGYLL